jgi:hypothetical protein
MAAGMAAVNEKHGLPSNFCGKSYEQGVKEGGRRLPARRDAGLSVLIQPTSAREADGAGVGRPSP